MSILLEQWAAWKRPRNGHLIHPDDEEAINRLPPGRIAPARTWSEYVGAPDFGTDDKQLHLQLLPIPFLGDVVNAKVIVLLQNPGFAPGDYHAELMEEEFPRLLEANLKQDFGNSDYPFLFLDPALAWHPGFTWWHRKLQPVIETLAQRLDAPPLEARRALAQHLAAIELLPYHSKNGVLTQAQLSGFASAAWARTHVQGVLKSARTDVIAMRHRRLWNADGELKGDRYLPYPPSQARFPTLRPGHASGGGDCIVNAVVRAMRGEA